MPMNQARGTRRSYCNLAPLSELKEQHADTREYSVNLQQKSRKNIQVEQIYLAVCNHGHQIKRGKVSINDPLI